MKSIRFEELNLSENTLKAVSELGYEEPTPIQAAAIPFLMQGKDVVGQAQTGTGKTASFAIPIVEKIDPSLKKIQALVLCPTRELCIQVAEGFTDLLKFNRRITELPIYGGQSIDRQLKALKSGVHIVIATPGRLIDHINRRTISLDAVETIVLDEADEMLNMGFREDIEDILKKLPKERQTVMFSATMPKPILDLSRKYLNSPEMVKVVHKELTVPNIDQYYYEVKRDSKLEVLSRLIDIHDPALSLVFCNTKRSVDELVSHLQARGYFADGLHGDMRQQVRDKVMAKFRTGKIEILIATDVAARGIDVDEVDAVFNYDVPQDEEYYVHRIGRTARAGRSGKAFTFVSGKDIYKIRDIERYTKTKVVRKNIPTMKDVEEIRANSFLNEIKAAIDSGGLEKHNDIINKLLEEDYTTAEIAAGLLKLQIKSQPQQEAKKETSDREYSNGEMVRLFVNIGKKNKISPKDIVGAFIGESGIPANSIGNIDIFDKFTFVDVENSQSEKVIRALNNNKIKGKKIAVEIAAAKQN